MHKAFDTGLVWLRRDLRLRDNAALSAALEHCREVHCAFVLDRAILDALPRADRRVEFIRETLVELDAQLRVLAGKADAGLIVLHDFATDAIPRLALQLGAHAVFAARDYEPTAIARDALVRDALAANGMTLVQVKDHVIFEGRELLTQTGTPYGVFTPYLRAWLARLGEQAPTAPPCVPRPGALAGRPRALALPVPELSAVGFAATNLRALGIRPGSRGAEVLLDDFWRRMVTGSFLVKHLGLDWRWGERYFAEKLNDFDLAANNGGWQWVSSSGCDAQPYFRIFNPIHQSKKFDADGQFIRRHLPALSKLGTKDIHAPWLANPAALATAGVVLGESYPRPIVDHAAARARTLERYAAVKTPAQASTAAVQ